jgi:hypothetical protein
MTDWRQMIRERAATLVRAARFVTTADFARERELMERKWYDYRFMSPVEATELFSEIFSKIYREKWREYFDKNESANKKGRISGNIIANRREFVSFWRARQFCDENGWLYDFYIREAMECIFEMAGESTHYRGPISLRRRITTAGPASSRP